MKESRIGCETPNERKREHASDAAHRELIELVEIIVRQRREAGPFWSKDVPPPMPGSWPTTQLKRLLCLAAEHEKLYAYSRILQLWLGRIGVPIPTKVFAKKISGPGTGPKLDKKKRAFGERAWQRQIELIIGHSDDLPEEELAARTETVWAAAPSYKASQIARELLPNRYHQGRAKREAARKYVAEAIALVKPTPEGFVDQFLSSERLDFQIDRIMGAKLPFD